MKHLQPTNFQLQKILTKWKRYPCIFEISFNKPKPPHKNQYFFKGGGLFQFLDKKTIPVKFLH